MEQKSIRLTWDQYELVKHLVDEIESITERYEEIEVMRERVWVKATKDYLIIIIEDDLEGGL